MSTEENKISLEEFKSQWLESYTSYTKSEVHGTLKEFSKVRELEHPFSRRNFFHVLFRDMYTIMVGIEGDTLDSISAVKLERLAQMAGFYPLTNEEIDTDMWIPFRKVFVDATTVFSSIYENKPYGDLIATYSALFSRLGMFEDVLAKSLVRHSSNLKKGNSVSNENANPISITEFITQKKGFNYQKTDVLPSKIMVDLKESVSLLLAILAESSLKVHNHPDVTTLLEMLIKTIYTYSNFFEDDEYIFNELTSAYETIKKYLYSIESDIDYRDIRLLTKTRLFVKEMSAFETTLKEQINE